MNPSPLRVATHSNQPYKLFLAITEILDRWADTCQWWEGEHKKLFWCQHLEDGQAVGKSNEEEAG